MSSILLPKIWKHSLSTKEVNHISNSYNAMGLMMEFKYCYIFYGLMKVKLEQLFLENKWIVVIAYH